MESRIDILKELKELSPVIAGMEKVNVFTVPSGYFERLGDDILVTINEGRSNLLSNITTPSSIQVPKGYFESLADNILNKIKEQESALEELGSLSPMLHSIQNENVFTVPQGYFELLSGAVLNKIKTAETPAEELGSLSPMLYSIQNENVFTVPKGYFENLPNEILNTVAPQQAKVVTIQKRTVTFFKYAAAAVFTGAMVLGVFKFTQNKNSIDPIIANGTQIAKENKFDEELAKINDVDIIKYLENNNEDVDAALVANTVDENELPSREDYLNDDKALDKYLDNIDLNDLKN